MIYTSQITYKNTKYQVAYDNNFNRLFYVINDDDSITLLTSKEEYDELNSLFDSSYSCLKIKDIKTKLNKRVVTNRINYLLSMLIAVGLGSVATFPYMFYQLNEAEENTITLMDTINDLQSTRDYIFNYYENNETLFNEAIDGLSDDFDIYETLGLNTNLTNEEKEKVINFYHTYCEKLPNYNLKVFNENLKTLKIKYLSEEDFEEKVIQENTIAAYLTVENLIVIKEGYTLEDSIYHELGHLTNKIVYNDVLYGFDIGVNGSAYGKGIIEGVNTLITEELFNHPGGYYVQTKACKMLAAIIGKEELIKCYSQGTVLSVETELEKINWDKSLSRETIRLIDELIVTDMDVNFASENVNKLQKLLIDYEFTKWYMEMMNGTMNVEKCMYELYNFCNLFIKEYTISETGDTVSVLESEDYFFEKYTKFYDRLLEVYGFNSLLELQTYYNIDFSKEHMNNIRNEYDNITDFDTDSEEFKLVFN